MQRRKFIALLGSTAVAWPWAAMAQQSSNKVWRIAHVYPGKLDNPPDRAMYDVFRGELRELGYIEGKNLIIASRKQATSSRMPRSTGRACTSRPPAWTR